MLILFDILKKHCLWSRIFHKTGAQMAWTGKANGTDINSIGNATGPETAEQNESAPHMEGTSVVYTAMTTATSQDC